MKILDCRGRARLADTERAEIAAAARAGGVILLPTDTLYGLGADPRSPAAIARVLRIKGRDPAKPLPVLLAARGLLPRFAAAVPARWEPLLRRFWPGPLTLLFPARPDLPPGIRSPAGEVALRVPGSALCRAVLRAAGGALTGTSANRSGRAGAADAREALRSLAGIALAVDAGTLPPSPASTIVGLGPEGGVRVLRAGAVSRGEIEDALA